MKKKLHRAKIFDGVNLISDIQMQTLICEKTTKSYNFTIELRVIFKTAVLKVVNCGRKVISGNRKEKLKSLPVRLHTVVYGGKSTLPRHSKIPSPLRVMAFASIISTYR